jgi:hypothetical protein
VRGFFPKPCVGDDLVFRELLVTVANRILLRVQDLRLTEKELEEVGFMLRRTWLVARAYREKRRELTLTQWIDRLVGLAKEAGVPVPS